MNSPSTQELLLLQLQAKANFARFSENPYPGRIIIAGLDESGENLVQLYAIMGRSENSRNRVFSTEGSRLFTEAADPAKVKDPSLIIYNAMLEEDDQIDRTAVVSNGHQTDSVTEGLLLGRNLEDLMYDWVYEPDKPNYTPRITATSTWLEDGISIDMSILRKSPFSDACDRHLYEINDVGRGFGYCFHTYSGDGDPLPAFRGEPYLVPLLGDMNNIANAYWEALNVDNRVSLAVKFIPKKGESKLIIVNQYSKVV